MRKFKISIRKFMPDDWHWIVLLFALTFPSIGIVQQVVTIFLPKVWPETEFSTSVAMIAGPSLYILGATLILVMLTKTSLAFQVAQLNIATIWVLFLLTIATLVALFTWLYPLTTAGLFGGGSDRDEALNIAVNELLSGRYPYYPVTYVPGLPHELGLDGNPISPMPGELLLAIPFVWLGNGAWQSFFWLLILAVMMIRQMKPGIALLAFWSLLLCSPVVLNEIVSGGDLLPISIWVLVFTLSLTNTSCKQRWPWIVLLGIGLASRINFLLIIPLITGELARLYGLRRGLEYGIWVTIVCGTIVLPFYFYDPPGFSPLHIESILMRFEPVLPNVKIVLPLVSGILALLLGALQMRYGTQRSLFWGCALVLAIPVLSVVTFSSVLVGHPEFVYYSWYGVGAMVFAWAAAWMPHS